MFQENEVITLLITVGMGLFLWLNRKPLHHVYRWKLLFFAFLFFLGSAFFTVIEGVVWENGFNHLEHLSALGFAVLFLAWCWTVGFSGKKNS